MANFLSIPTSLVEVLSGLQEFVHVSTTFRAVCYFLPCDLDLSEEKLSRRLLSCIGLFCPCFLFGKNAEFLGSGTFVGACMTHFIMWALLNTICCILTEGIFLGLPGCFVACYACGYRRALRLKYNLPDAPCGDLMTHFFCHLCAMCQEYREIRERTRDTLPHDLSISVVTAPPPQTMESGQ